MSDLRLILIKNQPGEDRYGELVCTNSRGEVLYDIVYDGHGYHNWPGRIDGDYSMANSELATYGPKALFSYLEHLQQYYNTKVISMV